MQDTFPGSFIIKVNDRFVAPAIDNGDDRLPARYGPEPAVFTLRGCRLECGDYVLGRSQIEDRSLLPKPVFWLKKGASSEMAQPTYIDDSSDAPQLLFGGRPAIDFNGYLMIDLIGAQVARSSIQPQ